MKTDVFGGVLPNFHAVFVSSGSVPPNELRHFAEEPNLVVGSLAEFSELLERSEWRAIWSAPSGLLGHEVIEATDAPLPQPALAGAQSD